MTKKAVYAGSFDPITKGHFDVIEQALEVFDEIVIAIGNNPNKKRLFTVAESQDLIREAVSQRYPNTSVITVSSFEGILVRFAEGIKATALVRGLRQISDFNDEFVQHGVNTRLSKLPIVYFICKNDFLQVSSSTAREVAFHGEDVSWLVDPNVEEALMQKFTTERSEEIIPEVYGPGFKEMLSNCFGKEI